MDTDQHLVIVRFMTWYWQTTSNNAIAAALSAAAIVNQLDESEGPKWPWRPSRRFTILKVMPDVWKSEEEGGINDELFRFFTRFTKAEMKELAWRLDLPLKYGYDKRTGYPLASVTSPEEALLIFCWRASHPLAFGHVISAFGRSRAWLGAVWDGVLQYIWEMWGSRIELDSKMMKQPTIEACCKAVGGSLGAATDLIFGFVDGTEVPVCRPMFADQQLYYSGHKKQHSLVHMAIVLPNGLFGSCFAGIPSSGGDATACIVLSFGERLGKLLSWLPPDQYRYLYGDAAFGSQDYVLGPYKGVNGEYITPTQKKINQWLSTKRIVVDQGFGGVKRNFKLLQLRTSLITGLSPIGIYLPVFSFLWNCQSCMRGTNQIAEAFGMSVPTLEEYVSGRFALNGDTERT